MDLRQYTATQNPLSDFIAEDRPDQQNKLTEALSYVSAVLNSLQSGTLNLDQLPIADLQRQLEATWHPQWTSEDTDDSLLGSLIGGRRNVSAGVTTATFSGTAESAVVTVNHGLDDVPIYANVAPFVAGLERIVGFIAGRASGDFSYVARNMTGTPLTGDFSTTWVAIG